MTKLLFPELSYKITGFCFKIHKELGRFCREKQYADALEKLFNRNKVSYKREYEINNFQRGPKGNKVDFLIENKIIIDLKAKKFITKEDYNQMQRYLQSSGLELGLIINFRNTYLKPKRVLNTKTYSDNSDANLDNSDRPYKILEHITDLKIQGFGKTKQELFLNILKGMTAAMQAKIRSTKPLPRRQAGETRNIKIESTDLDALLVDFLNEVLYLSQTNKEVYNNVKFNKFSDPAGAGQVQLEGELTGSKVELFGEDIKAATYHGIKINQNKKGLYQATVLFDI